MRICHRPISLILLARAGRANLRMLSPFHFRISQKFSGSFSDYISLKDSHSVAEYDSVSYSDQSNLGISITPGGLLFPFQLGICASLIDSGVLTDETPIAGSSAGALVAAVVGCGLEFRSVLDETENLFEKCRVNGTRGKLKNYLIESLEKLLPTDAHRRIENRLGTVNVQYTAFSPLPSCEIVNKFESKGDLIECLIASCHVPFWFSSDPLSSVRGQYGMDGFFSSPYRSFGAPMIPNVRKLLKVSAFPSRIASIESDFEGGVISPDFVDDMVPSDLMYYALNPGSPEQLLKFYGLGKLAARRWEEKYGDTLTE